MIESLRGTVEACTPDAAVLRLGGVSLRLGVTAETVRTLRPGEFAELFTHLYIREDVLTLYGFATTEERSFFEKLLAISGVGPRAALGFLSTFTPAALRDAIEQEDLTKLTRVPGIGRKTAQRVVLELKGKLERVEGSSPAASPPALNPELLSALMGLGYSAAEAGEALQHGGEVAAAGTDEERLRAALRYFAHR